MKRFRCRCQPVMLAAALSVVVTGCMDGLTDLGDEFDAGEASRLVTTLGLSGVDNLAVAHVSEASRAIGKALGIAGLVAPGSEVRQEGVLAAASRTGATHRSRAPRGDAPELDGRESMTLSARGDAAIFPPSLLGRTFILTQLSGWAIDTASKAAPPNGVRFVMYSLDKVTGAPQRIPLNKVGYMDVLDESHVVPRLRVVGIEGSSLVADFFLEGEYTSSETELASAFTGAGTIIQNRQTDFSVVDEVNFLDGLTRAVVHFERDIEVPESDISANLVVDGEIKADPEDQGAVNVIFSVTDGAHVVSMALVDTGVAVAGTMSWDGEVVIVISGDPSRPTFARPDGSFPKGEATPLANLYFAAEAMLNFGDDMLVPLSELWPSE